MFFFLVLHLDSSRHFQVGVNSVQKWMASVLISYKGTYGPIHQATGCVWLLKQSAATQQGGLLIPSERQFYAVMTYK